MTPPVAALPGEAVLAKIAKAKQVVRELCQGKRLWTMSIPARPDYDPDIVIVDALNAALDLLAPSAPRAEAESFEESMRVDGILASGILFGGSPPAVAHESLKANPMARSLALQLLRVSRATPGERAREKGVEHG